MTLIAAPEEWVNVLESKGVTELIFKIIKVVDAYNSWCGPCTAIHPTFQRLQNHLNQSGLKLNFFLAATDKVEDLQKYNVGSEPLFVIYVDGKVKETVGGGVNLPRILRTLSKYVSPDAIFSFSPAQEAPPPPPFTPRGGDGKPLLMTPRALALQQQQQQQQKQSQQPQKQPPLDIPPIQILVPSNSNPSIDLIVPDLPSESIDVPTDESSPDTERHEKEGNRTNRTVKSSPRPQKKSVTTPKLSLSPAPLGEINQASPRSTKKQSPVPKLKKTTSGGNA